MFKEKTLYGICQNKLFKSIILIREVHHWPLKEVDCFSPNFEQQCPIFNFSTCWFKMFRHSHKISSSRPKTPILFSQFAGLWVWMHLPKITCHSFYTKNIFNHLKSDFIKVHLFFVLAIALLNYSIYAFSWMDVLSHFIKQWLLYVEDFDQVSLSWKTGTSDFLVKVWQENSKQSFGIQAEIFNGTFLYICH